MEWLVSLKSSHRISILWISPRRFGKSVFLSMMSAYYDINMEDEFDTLCGNLWIGSHPTKLKNGFQVMYFDFSLASAGMGTLQENFNSYCCIIVDSFINSYRRFYSDTFVQNVLDKKDAAEKLKLVNSEAHTLHYPLYLIIDEYDNFTNVVLSEHGKDVFKELTH